MTRLHVSMSFSARLSLVHFVAWNPTSTEFQPQLLTDLSRLSNGCSLYVWCLVCPRSHSALPLCLHFHRPFAHIRSSFRPTSWIPLPLSACPLHFSVSPFSSVLPRPHHPRPHLSSFFPCLLPLISSLYVLSFFYCSAPPLYPISPFSCLPSLDTILVQAGPPHFHLVSLP